MRQPLYDGHIPDSMTCGLPATLRGLIAPALLFTLDFTECLL